MPLYAVALQFQIGTHAICSKPICGIARSKDEAVGAAIRWGKENVKEIDGYQVTTYQACAIEIPAAQIRSAYHELETVDEPDHS